MTSVLLPQSGQAAECGALLQSCRAIATHSFRLALLTALILALACLCLPPVLQRCAQILRSSHGRDVRAPGLPTSFALEKINALIKTKTGSFEVLKNNVIVASRC